ncbi:MAG: hypothetical protein LBE20_06850 [Deltaproteobacteria bacterium]|jgi:hypothetical protein|nr:hypothetical protein [Deltaproteobacteria bacterium]
MIDYKELKLNIIATIGIGFLSVYLGYLLYNSSLNPNYRNQNITEDNNTVVTD